MNQSHTTLLNLHSTSMSHKERGRKNGVWVPNTDIYVTDESLVIKVELSGMRREDLELSIEDNLLRISGQRPDNCRNAKCKFLVVEIQYGSFECVLEIPSGYDLNNAQAIYQNGFLRIDVPKSSQDSSPSTIPIRSE